MLETHLLGEVFQNAAEKLGYEKNIYILYVYMSEY